MSKMLMLLILWIYVVCLVIKFLEAQFRVLGIQVYLTLGFRISQLHIIVTLSLAIDAYVHIEQTRLSATIVVQSVLHLHVIKWSALEVIWVKGTDCW